MNAWKPVALLMALCLSPVALAALPQGKVPNHYIISLREPVGGVLQGVTRLLSPLGVKPSYLYEKGFKGFAARLTPAQVTLLARNPLVKAIEQDQWVAANASEATTRYGLATIDGSGFNDARYTYPDSAGNGVHVYVVDSGLRASHAEFAGRVGNGNNLAPDTGLLDILNLSAFGLPALPIPDLGLPLLRVTPRNSTEDCNGHGTHVAGTAVGTTSGVAKRATVHPVRVLGCNGSGTVSALIAGLDWVASNVSTHPGQPAVVNLSIGSPASVALDDAAQRLIANNVSVVASAGNDNRGDCSGSPQRLSGVLVVAASDLNNARASYSNFGRCVDVFAPGDRIVSAGRNSDTGTAELSGTSMASPHVAGAVALLLGTTTNRGLTAIQVQEVVKSTATPGKVTNAGLNTVSSLLNTSTFTD